MKALIQHKDKDSTRWMLQALVPFKELKSSVLFTYRSNPYQKEQSNKDEFEAGIEFYQRRVDSKRSDAIKDFIYQSIQQERRGVQMATLFPSSMILALNVDNDDKRSNYMRENKDGSCDLDIRTNVFIVDGQHRMMGMIKLYDELSRLMVKCDEDNYALHYLEEYKFNCTILVNYDLWEQGQVFVNVNFKQKPVNKSLYYEIFGAEYREDEKDEVRNKIYLAHSMARYLNSHPDSPFYNRIKMLGTGKGYVSQAFVVEALMRLFNKGRLWYFDSETSSSVDTDYYGTELLSFFVAVHKMFSKYWPEKNSDKGTLICKTTGVGAWIRMIDMMRSDEDFETLYLLKKSANNGTVCQEYVTQVCDILTPIQKNAEKLFGKDSEFAKSSGGGTETKLFKKMLSYIDNPYSVEENIKGVNLEKLYELLQEYVWSSPIDDLNSLCHHYDIQDIFDFKLESLSQKNGTIIMKAHCNLNTTLYIDNEDESGFFMQFPAVCSVVYEKNNDAYNLKENEVSISVDTDKYYQ